MIELDICVGSACHIRGSYNVIQLFQQMIEEYSLHDKVKLKASFCMRQCQNRGISVSVNDQKYEIMTNNAQDFFKYTVMPLLEESV